MNILLTLLLVAIALSSCFYSISKSYELIERTVYSVVAKYLEQGDVIFLQGKYGKKVKRSLIRLMFVGIIPLANLILPFIYKAYITSVIEKAKGKSAKIYKLSDQEIEKVKRCKNCDELKPILETVLDEAKISFRGMNTRDNVINLTYDNQLVPMAYTLDEVRMISEYLDIEFNIYKIDGINTAIISDDITEETTILVNGESKAINLGDFTNPDNRFKVYLGKTNVEMMKRAEECIQKISEKRRTKNDNIMSTNINIIQNKEKKLTKVLR